MRQWQGLAHASPTGQERLSLGGRGIAVILLLVVAYFTGGGLHGLYADDYVYKSFTVNPVSGAWKPMLEWNAFRPLNYLIVSNWAAMLPNLELFTRLSLIVLHLLNVLLLGGLVRRLGYSRQTAFIAGVYFLLPVFANETLLWFTAAAIYLPSLCLLLIGFHMALTPASGIRRWLYLAGALLAWWGMLLFIESGFFVLALLPVFVVLRQQAGVRLQHKTWLVGLSIIYLIFTIYLFSAVLTAPTVYAHGEPTLDVATIIMQRGPDLATNLVDYLGDWGTGGVYRDAMELGLREWLAGLGNGFVIGGLFVSLGLGVWSYSPDQEQKGKRPSGHYLFIMGLAWIALTLAPVLFIKDLSVASRVLYFPSAGLGLSLAGLAEGAVNWSVRWRRITTRIVLAFTATILFISSLTMGGLERVYQLRWELDQTQMQALLTSIPTLPSLPLWVLALDLDERPVSPSSGHHTVLNRYLYGLFEIPWAAEPALQMAYRQTQIHLVDQDAHGQVHLQEVQVDNVGQVIALTFQGTVQRQQILVTRLLAFTIKNGRVILLDPLVIAMPDHSTLIVNLPPAAHPMESLPVHLTLEEQ